MSAEPRRSIGRPAPVSGVGLHTGAQATLTFHPAPAGHGVVFYRTDLGAHPGIPASVDHVDNVDRRTALGVNGARVETVEHVLAAVAAHGIDDVRIELDGPEAPIGDGSAAAYFKALAEAGVTPIGGEAPRIQLQTPLKVQEGDATYLVAPGKGLRLTVTIEWPHPLIGRQSGCYDVTPDHFASELAPARTFGFLDEADELRGKGLARGAQPGRLLVLTRDGLQGGQLRWPDEFVRHKAADLLGDLLLLGARFEGEVVAFRPSHKGNVALARAIRRAAIAGSSAVMGISEILGTLPHRYPMLLVDRIIELEPGRRVVGIKNVTINEPFFQGHFPNRPVMPGVLILEAMAQTGGTLLMGSVEKPEDKLVYFVGIDGVRFRRVVVPGDQLRFEVELVQRRGLTVKMRGTGYVDGQVAAEAEMLARIVER